MYRQKAQVIRPLEDRVVSSSAAITAVQVDSAVRGELPYDGLV
jgi:hypothetical protein